MLGSNHSLLGGVGFGNDTYPSSYYYHSDFSILGNGSVTGNRDPYLPIEQEPMGNEYSPTNFSSSLPANNVYPYTSAMADFNSAPERYTFENSKTLSDVLKEDPSLASSKTSAKQTTKQTVKQAGKKERMQASAGSYDGTGVIVSGNTMLIFMFMLFILMVILAYLQNLQIQQLYKVMKKMVKHGISGSSGSSGTPGSPTA